MDFTLVGRNRPDTTVRPVLGTDVSFLLAPEETGGAFELLEIVVPEGAGIPPHAHPWGEVYYITEGLLSIDAGEEHHDLAPGGLLNLPRDVVHGFTATSTTRLLLMCEGAAFGDICREIPAEPPSERTMAIVAESMAKRGMVLAMPDAN